MGEYAKRKEDNQQIKIGVCEDLCYLRFEDVLKVNPLPGNVVPGDINLFYRLPFVDEDNFLPGDYPEHKRTLPIKYYLPLDIRSHRGQIIFKNRLPKTEKLFQFRLSCDHSGDFKDKNLWLIPREIPASNFSLARLKSTKDGIKPIIECNFCGMWFRTDWADIWDKIPQEYQQRFFKYYEIEKAHIEAKQ